MLHGQGVPVSDRCENETGSARARSGIAQALQELGITWIPAHERGFQTAQARWIRGCNHDLETEFLPWVNTTLAVAPASADGAHRPLEKHHDLAAILSHVESVRVTNDYTFPLGAKI